MFGHSEHWNDFHYDRPAGVDFVCFTDDATLRSEFWEMRLMPASTLDPHRHSKSFKHRPHLHFPDHAVSLYIDNTVKLIAPVEEIFAFVERTKAPMVTFRHPERDCVYEEAAVIIRDKIDDPERVQAQMALYRKRGYPEHAGLHTLSMLLRRHHDKKLIKVLEALHEEIRRYSKRDQLAFDVLRRRYRLKVTALPGTVYDNALMTWPEIRNGARVPRNFDDARYLKLHPDVAAAKINPRQHYLHHGFAEGRSTG